MRKICQWLASKLPGLVIQVPDPITHIKTPYLGRYYFFLKDRKYFNIFLHHFLSSDLDLELHNHPFKWSFGLILVGGYKEEFRNSDDTVSARVFKPWSINFITNNTFHRVELLEKDAWTIFIAGPRGETWGFWDPVTKEYRDFKTSPNAIP